jgi:hypothetical protein
MNLKAGACKEKEVLLCEKEIYRLLACGSPVALRLLYAEGKPNVPAAQAV